MKAGRLEAFFRSVVTSALEEEHVNYASIGASLGLSKQAASDYARDLRSLVAKLIVEEEV